MISRLTGKHHHRREPLGSMRERLAEPRPILILDTSVFIRDALSTRGNGAAAAVLAFAAAVAHVVTCDEIEAEIFEKLNERVGYGRAAVVQRYGDILRNARFVVLPEERDDHRLAVQRDGDDTMLVRTAEAVSAQCTEIWEAGQLHLLVSENTRHLRPNHWFAGFEFVTSQTALHRIGAHTLDP